MIMLITILTGTVYSQNISDMDILEKEVLETIKEWNQTFDQNNPEAYFNHIHDDLSLFIASSPYRIDGKSDDREEFEWSLKSGRTRVSLFQELQLKVQILSETSALVTYHTRGIYGSEGQEHITYLKETNVLIKEDNEWKIVHIHVSK